MLVDRCFVLKNHRLVRAMSDTHHIDVAKLRPAFPPIRMGHDMMTTDFAPGLDFSSRRHRPME